MEQEIRLATKTANKAIIPERLVNGKSAHQERLSFVHAYNLEAELVEAAHQTHEAIVNRTITTPQTTAVELTQAK